MVHTREFLSTPRVLNNLMIFADSGSFSLTQMTVNSLSNVSDLAKCAFDYVDLSVCRSMSKFMPENLKNDFET